MTICFIINKNLFFYKLNFIYSNKIVTNLTLLEFI